MQILHLRRFSDSSLKSPVQCVKNNNLREDGVLLGPGQEDGVEDSDGIADDTGRQVGVHQPLPSKYVRPCSDVELHEGWEDGGQHRGVHLELSHLVK